MIFSPHSSPYSRRRFLQQLLGAGAFTVPGIGSLLARDLTPTGTQGFRFAFLTDLHLMLNGGLRSGQGIAACLTEVEKLNPRPDFILVGGDLVNSTRELTIPQASTSLDNFLQIWHDHTSLPTHWTFGNHDLAGTNNPSVPIDDISYGKGLFQDRLQMPKLFYSFDCKGWHFVVLDDIAIQANHGYFGQLAAEDLAFLQTDLDAHRRQPTIVCTHIPLASNLPLGLLLAHQVAGYREPESKSLVCTNGDAVIQSVPGHNIRAILSGHLHFHEQLEMKGVRLINSGAVCGNFWKGSMYGCPEGFGVVDLGADGSVAFDYRTYGWQA